MTAPMRRPVAYEVAVGRHVPQPDMAQMDAEWSDAGRSPRFLPGWWIVPGVLLGAAFWAWVVYVIGKAWSEAALAALQAGG